MARIGCDTRAELLLHIMQHLCPAPGVSIATIGGVLCWVFRKINGGHRLVQRHPLDRVEHDRALGIEALTGQIGEANVATGAGSESKGAEINPTSLSTLIDCYIRLSTRVDNLIA